MVLNVIQIPSHQSSIYNFKNHFWIQARLLVWSLVVSYKFKRIIFTGNLKKFLEFRNDKFYSLQFLIILCLNLLQRSLNWGLTQFWCLSFILQCEAISNRFKGSSSHNKDFNRGTKKNRKIENSVNRWTMESETALLNSESLVVELETAWK